MDLEISKNIFPFFATRNTTKWSLQWLQMLLVYNLLCRIFNKFVIFVRNDRDGVFEKKKSSWICHTATRTRERVVISLRLTGTCFQLMQSTRCKAGTIAKHQPTCTENLYIRLHMCARVYVKKKVRIEGIHLKKSTERYGKDGNERVLCLWDCMSVNRKI